MEMNREPRRGISSFAVSILFVCMMLVGLALIPRLSVKLEPSKKQASLNISFSMWGQSARVVEAEVTSKLESMFNRMRGVENITSYSGNGHGNITVRFSKHTDPDLARFEASAIIRQAWPQLPEGLSYPAIRIQGIEGDASAPFLYYTINAPLPPIAIQEYAQQNIAPRIAELPGVDKIDVSGGGRMIHKLVYDYDNIRQYGVSVDDIRSAVAAYLSREFLGMARAEDESDKWIRIVLGRDEGDKPFDTSKILVKNSGGTLIRLDQLVVATYQEEEPNSYFRINGLNTVYLSVTATRDANQLALSREIGDVLQKSEQLLPEGYQLRLSYDAGEYITAELKKIYFRAGLTVLILLAFILLAYRNWRYSLMIILSLVANLLVAVIFYYLVKLEIELYSLAGLTISFTLIIDNIIIMSDQIVQRGNRKAFVAILTATATTIGTLSVIFMMDERTRLNLTGFAWVIIINMAVSMLITLFLVPALIERMKIRKRIGRTQERKLGAFLKRRFSPLTKLFSRKRAMAYFNRIYRWIIRLVWRRRWWFIAGIILLFGLPVYLLPNKIEPNVKRSFFEQGQEEELNLPARLYNKTIGSNFYNEKMRPVVNFVLGGTSRLFAEKVKEGSYYSNERGETTLHVIASMPNGTTIAQMDALIRQMEKYIGQYREIRQFETRIDNSMRASINIMFHKEFQRGSFPYQLQSALVSQALKLGGGSWGVHGVGDGFSNDLKEQAGSQRIKIMGYGYDDLLLMAEQMRDSLLSYRRIETVTIDSKFSWFKNDYMEFVFDLELERLAQQNIQPLQLYASLSPIFLHNSHAGNWRNNGKDEPIRLYSDHFSSLDMWNMKNYPLEIDGTLHKLSELARIDKAQAAQDIAKENQQYMLCLQYEYLGSYQQAQKVTKQIVENFNQRAPLGYKAEIDGYYWGGWGNDDNSGKYWLLLLVIVIIFFMSGILLNSLRQPLIIIFIIPISFIGIFLTFYWFGLKFDQGGFAAFILLSALAVNANIYILNEYNNIRRATPDMPVSVAYMKAWNTKIRPIFLTIISTVLGFIPFLIGQHREAFWFPLAAGTIGGLIFSLIALFIFLPLFMGVGKKQSNKTTL